MSNEGEAREERGAAREEREVNREERGISREEREAKREESAVSRDEEAQARDYRDVSNHASVSRARWRVRIGLGLIGTFAVLTVAFVVVLFLPYEPMKINSYYILPSTACPGQLLKAKVSYTVEPGARIQQATSQAIWTAVDVKGYEEGERLGGADSIIPPSQLEPGRYSDDGELLRPAPIAPGVWQFSAVVTVHGSSVTQIQRLTPTAESPTTVRDRASEECKGGV